MRSNWSHRMSRMQSRASAWDQVTRTMDENRRKQWYLRTRWNSFPSLVCSRPGSRRLPEKGGLSTSFFSYTLERKQRKKSLSHRFTESKYAADTVYHVKCISECDNLKNQRPARDEARRHPQTHIKNLKQMHAKKLQHKWWTVPSLSVGRIYFLASPHRSRHLVSCARSRLHSWHSIRSIRTKNTWRGRVRPSFKRRDFGFLEKKHNEWWMLFLRVYRNHFFLRFSASFASLGPGISTNPSLLATKNTIGGDPSS